jgi:hypothetical protein
MQQQTHFAQLLTETSDREAAGFWDRRRSLAPVVP